MPKPYINKNVPVSKIFGGAWAARPKHGDSVGLEIEIEATSPRLEDGSRPPPTPAKFWTIHNDGSLRAPPRGWAAEYVFTQPLPSKDAFEAIDYLDGLMKDNAVRYAWSTRTSIHVHVNVQDLNMTQLVNFILLYSVFEDLLSEFCGPERMGNLFCLRFKDSDHLIDALKETLRTGQHYTLVSNDHRYSACNTASLVRFGTLEFRMMEGTNDWARVKQWVLILLRLKEFAKNSLKDPTRIIQDFSSDGPDGFIRRIFGYSAASEMLMSFKDYRNRLWESLRFIQEVAFCVTWEDPPVPETKKEPQPRYADIPRDDLYRIAIDEHLAQRHARAPQVQPRGIAPGEGFTRWVFPE